MNILFLVFYGFLMLGAVVGALWESVRKKRRKQQRTMQDMTDEIDRLRRVVAHQQKQLGWYRNHV